MTIKRNISLLFAIIFLKGFVFYGPIATLYRQSQGLNLGQIFTIESICLAIMITLEIPWGWIADRIGYKKTLIISNGLFFISKIVFWKATGFYGFLMERIILAIAISGASGCDSAMLYKSCDSNQSDKIFSKYTMLSSFGFLLASALSTFMLKVSMETTTFFTIFPYAISFVLTLFLIDLPISKNENNSIFNHLKTAFSNTTIIYLVLASALMIEINQATTVFLNQDLYIKSGIPIHWFGPILIIIQCFRMLSGKTYKLTRKFGEFKVMIFLAITTTTLCIYLSLFSYMITSILGIIIIATCCSIMMPIVSNIQNQNIDSTNRATILSIYSMIMSLVGVPSNLIIGQFAKTSFKLGFVTCSIMGILMFICLIRFKIKLSTQNTTIPSIK